MIEPHHVHLLEMRAARPDATAGEMLRAYNTASNFAAGICRFAWAK